MRSIFNWSSPVGGRKSPTGGNHRKPCSEHNETATYCSMERRWICPKCPINKILKETGFLVMKEWRIK